MGENFSHDLDRYAEVITEVGLNLQLEQRLLIRAPLEASDLVRSIARVAYSKKDSPLVQVLWEDDQLKRIRFSEAPEDSFNQYEKWKIDAQNQAAQSGDALLNIIAEHPGIMKGIDPVRFTTYEEAFRTHAEIFRGIVGNKKTNWAVAAAATPAWAADLFPGELPETQLSKLWQAFFQTARLDHDNPLQAWHEHNNNLRRRVAVLHKLGLTALHLSSDKTDLVVGLAENHLWCGGVQVTSDERRIPFNANIPTEEVFTMPHKNTAQGTVATTKPLMYKGFMAKNISLRFEEGRVVEVRGDKKDVDIVEQIVNRDEGSSRLGEVGLVGTDSPVAEMGIVFGNTLFDENTAVHLALGNSYSFTMKNGSGLLEEEYAKRGGNKSSIHVDFMVGSEEMDIDGITREDTKVPVMRSGLWVI